MSFEPGLPGEETGKSGARYLIVEGNGDLIVRSNPKDTRILMDKPPEEIGLTVIHDLYAGRLDGTPVYAAEVAHRKPPKGYRTLPLRALFERLSAEEMGMVSRAIQLLAWERSNRYCGRCATKMERRSDEVACVCPECGFTTWPRISPAMIVAVQKDNKLLLAKAVSFRREMYSVLAGYVEPGETLEYCVAREVREEVGIEVDNIRYVASQSWPFSQSLMVAFRADWIAGELKPDKREILDARWVTVEEIDALPCPLKGSVARELIDQFIAGER